MKPENRAALILILAVVLVVGVGGGSVLYVSWVQTSSAVLLVVASTEGGVYMVNETVNVTLAITNRGTETLNLSWSCMGDGIRVSNAAGEVLFDSTRRLCPLVMVAWALPPGQTRTALYQWTADVSPLTRYSIDPVVAAGVPGEYVGTIAWIV